MTKEELEINLKNFKKNMGSIKIKELQLKRMKNELKELQNEVYETNIIGSMGINCDIRSKGSVSNKVENAIIMKEKDIENLQEKILNLKKDISNLNDVVEDTRIRFEALSYKKRKIIEAYYFEDKTADEIGNVLYFKLFKQTRNPRTIYSMLDTTLLEMSKI